MREMTRREASPEERRPAGRKQGDREGRGSEAEDGWRAGGEVTERGGESLAYQPDPSPPLPTPSLRVQREPSGGDCCPEYPVLGEMTSCTAAPGFPLCARADAGREWLGCCMAGDSRAAAPTRTTCPVPGAVRCTDGARREMDAPSWR